VTSDAQGHESVIELVASVGIAVTRPSTRYGKTET
jgi:hypothetical protein